MGLRESKENMLRVASCRLQVTWVVWVTWVNEDTGCKLRNKNMFQVKEENTLQLTC